MNCPHCNILMTKNGANPKGTLRYKCPDCGKTATEGGKAIGRPKKYASDYERLKAWRKKQRESQ